jgi:hypothetical protein
MGFEDTTQALEWQDLLEKIKNLMKYKKGAPPEVNMALRN